MSLVVHAAPAEAQAAAPVRSGTILGAYTLGLGPAGCSLVPDCAAWRAVGCDPRLAGQDPAVLTSIVDVSDLAGSDRSLVRDGRLPWSMWLYSNVEFWSSDCRVAGYAPHWGDASGSPERHGG